MTPVRVLVTGGSGYLGQFLLDELMKQPERVVPFATYFNTPAGLPDGLPSSSLDVNDPESVQACLFMFQPDVLVNCAAMSSPAASEKDPVRAKSTNAPTELLEGLKKANPKAVFIQLSTDQVYDGDHPVYVEEADATPTNTYGQSKLDFENELRRHWPRHYILRSSLIYGPSPPRPCGKGASFLQFLSNSLEKATAASPVTLFEDEIRCPILVSDVVEIIKTLIHAPFEELCTKEGASGVTLNMGGPERLSRMQMGAVVAGLQGYAADRMSPCRRAGMDLGFQSPLDISMDSSKLVQGTVGREAFGGKGATSFKEGVKSVLQAR